jgi:hypothetical protein
MAQVFRLHIATVGTLAILSMSADDLKSPVGYRRLFRYCFGLAQGETTYDDLAKRLGRRLLSLRGHSQRLQYAGSGKRVGIITSDKTNNFIILSQKPLIRCLAKG